MRPMRSVLFVPGHRGTWVEKGIASEADGLILDLEDAVPVALKDQARAEVVTSIARVRETNSRIGLWVRVNAFDSGLTGTDLEAVVVAGVDGVLLPMICSSEDVIRLDALITHFEHMNGVEPGSVAILVGLETAEAYASCEALALASPRVATLFAGVAGDADVSRSIGFQFTAEGLETLYIRSRVVLACRSAGLDFPLGGIWQDIHDVDGARYQCRQNRQLGFRGQVCIHPSHVPIANEVFGPSAAEIEYYRGMIAAFEVAEAGGAGAVAYEGMHVDYAHIKTAREFLAYAESLAAG
jgi:citrate lyase subunit beta / citryl-CoA lyase